MLRQRKPPESSARIVFADTQQVEEQRAEQVWRYASVALATWSVFILAFQWMGGFGYPVFVCMVESGFMLLLILSCRNSSNYRFVMSACLGATAIGLYFLSISHPSLRGTLLFLPLGILISSQLFGSRAAIPWLLMDLGLCVLHALAVHGFEHAISSSVFHEVAMACGVGVCTFFCCHQAEQYFQRRAEDLVELSRGLQDKSQELQWLATTDSLTGLKNRFQFQKELKNGIEKAVASGKLMALFLVDIDGFKDVNDTLGHTVGDDALVEISTRLWKGFGEESIVCRLGGDEFCLIRLDLESREEAIEMAKAINEVIDDRYVFEDAEFPLGASVGVAFCPEDTTTTRELLAFADTAMFEAKQNRSGFVAYEKGMTDRLVEYRTTQEKLSFALDRDEFFLVFQPLTNIESGKVVSVEALLRWKCEGEVISPVRFIPLLEKSQQIIPVSRWVVHECCRQLRKWVDEGYDVRVSINVSVVQFNDPDFCASIEASIRHFGIDASMLDFEVTEGVLIGNMEEAVDRLERLKTLGASISIDDFGTGYSSLAYLQRLPLDKIKIDRAFIKDIPDSDDGAIASSIIVLAKTLGLKVVAEGVETEEQLQFLKNYDCDEYQGYYKSRPAVPEEVIAMFTKPDDRELRNGILSAVMQ